jgi:hypothetical protein
LDKATAATGEAQAVTTHGTLDALLAGLVRRAGDSPQPDGAQATDVLRADAFAAVDTRAKTQADAQLDAQVQVNAQPSPLMQTLANIDLGVFVEEADYHGVLPLVAERIAGRTDVPALLRALLCERAQAAVAADLARETELRRVVGALGAAGIRPLLFKGSQLAYSHYPRPDLRPRIDTDMLIPADARAHVDDVLTSLGYARRSSVSGELVSGQAFYVRRVGGVPTDAVDVHWKIASPIVFANILSYDELAADAVPIPALGPGARGLGEVHALLVACVHRVAHHLDAVRLKWLYDIDLVARRMDAAGWQRFAAAAEAKRVAAVCRRSLERAAQLFGTPVPAHLWAALQHAEGATREVTAEYLTPRPQAEALADDLKMLGSWRERLRLVREHVVPPAAYMRQVYAPASKMPLPVLYAWRVVRGAKKWLFG